MLIQRNSFCKRKQTWLAEISSPLEVLVNELSWRSKKKWFKFFWQYTYPRCSSSPWIGVFRLRFVHDIELTITISGIAYIVFQYFGPAKIQADVKDCRKFGAKLKNKELSFLLFVCSLFYLEAFSHSLLSPHVDSWYGDFYLSVWI